MNDGRITFGEKGVGGEIALLGFASTHLRFLIDAILLATLSIGALYATARVALIPRDAERGMAVVFAPWTTPAVTLQRAVEAGGRFVRFGGHDFIAIVMPEDAKYPERVLAAGAWLVADPRALAACLSPFERSVSQ